MSDKQVNTQIGSVEEMGARFVEAWHAAERGKAVARDHATFLSLETQSIYEVRRLVKACIDSGFEPHDGKDEIKAQGRRKHVLLEIQTNLRTHIKEPFTVDDFIADRRAEAARE